MDFNFKSLTRVVKFNNSDTTHEYQQLDQIISNNIRKHSNGQWYCIICKHIANHSALLNHMEAKHFPGPGVVCEVCMKVTPTRHAHRMHLARVHHIHGKKKKKAF